MRGRLIVHILVLNMKGEVPLLPAEVHFHRTTRFSLRASTSNTTRIALPLLLHMETLCRIYILYISFMPCQLLYSPNPRVMLHYNNACSRFKSFSVSNLTSQACLHARFPLPPLLACLTPFGCCLQRVVLFPFLVGQIRLHSMTKVVV